MLREPVARERQTSVALCKEPDLLCPHRRAGELDPAQPIVARGGVPSLPARNVQICAKPDGPLARRAPSSRKVPCAIDAMTPG